LTADAILGLVLAIANASQQPLAATFQRHAEGSVRQPLDHLVVGRSSDQLLENAPPRIWIGTNPFPQLGCLEAASQSQQSAGPFLALSSDHVLLGGCHIQSILRLS
jgi:hypothetical protein